MTVMTSENELRCHGLTVAAAGDRPVRSGWVSQLRTLAMVNRKPSSIRRASVGALYRDNAVDCAVATVQIETYSGACPGSVVILGWLHGVMNPIAIHARATARRHLRRWSR